MDILAILHQDHINMYKLLTQLENNSQQIRAGRAPDLKLMAEAIEYIGHYADLYHHPLEDLLYEYFSNRSEALDLKLDHCQREHRELAAITEQTLQPITLSLLDGLLPMSQIIIGLDQFLAAQRSHLNFEESQVFPMIKESANVEDWSILKNRSETVTASAISEFDKFQYQAIYSELSASNCS